MDETLQELENELKRLTPLQPSTASMQALERELGAETVKKSVPPYSTATSRSSWKWATWSLAGVAAAVALVVLVQSERRPDAAPVSTGFATTKPAAAPAAVKPVNRYEPVQASSVLYDLQESSPTPLPDRTEGREVRYRYVDTYTWKNPATNASLRWSVPRDEVRLVRASLD
jgi:hypothetical protein